MSGIVSDWLQHPARSLAQSKCWIHLKDESALLSRAMGTMKKPNQALEVIADEHNPVWADFQWGGSHNLGGAEGWKTYSRKVIQWSSATQSKNKGNVEVSYVSLLMIINNVPIKCLLPLKPGFCFIQRKGTGVGCGGRWEGGDICIPVAHSCWSAETNTML